MSGREVHVDTHVQSWGAHGQIHLKLQVDKASLVPTAGLAGLTT